MRDIVNIAKIYAGQLCAISYVFCAIWIKMNSGKSIKTIIERRRI